LIVDRLNPKLWFLKGRSYFDRPTNIRLNEAIGYAEKALSADTGAVHVYHLLAMLEKENGNNKKAEEYFVKAFEGNTQWSKAAIELGYFTANSTASMLHRYIIS